MSPVAIRRSFVCGEGALAATTTAAAAHDKAVSTLSAKSRNRMSGHLNILILAEREGSRCLTISYGRRAPRLQIILTFFLNFRLDF